jgi:hypothetical protein
MLWFADSCVDENDELAFLQGILLITVTSTKSIV